MGGKKHSYKTTLPSGREAKMHNGDRGFIKRAPCTLRIWESFKFLPGFGIPLVDKLSIGAKTNAFPATLNVSKHHLTAACLNNYYFLKDAGSKHGSYVKLAKGGPSKGGNGRVELHKGMTFSVGRLGFKVSDIQGAASDNKAAIAARDKARKEAEAKQAASGAKEEELDSDEEFADSDDDDGGGGGGKATKLDGPPVMFLSSVDKKLAIRGRIRATSPSGRTRRTTRSRSPTTSPRSGRWRRCTRGSCSTTTAGSSWRRPRAASAPMSACRARNSLVNLGDKLLLGGCRRATDALYPPILVRPLDGIIEHMMGADELSVYDMTIGRAAPIEADLRGHGGARAQGGAAGGGLRRERGVAASGRGGGGVGGGRRERGERARGDAAGGAAAARQAIPAFAAAATRHACWQLTCGEMMMGRSLGVWEGGERGGGGRAGGGGREGVCARARCACAAHCVRARGPPCVVAGRGPTPGATRGPGAPGASGSHRRGARRPR